MRSEDFINYLLVVTNIIKRYNIIINSGPLVIYSLTAEYNAFRYNYK